MAKVSGTFSGAGQSASWCGGNCVVVLSYAGNAVVAVEIYDDVNANWVALATHTNASFAGKYDGYGKTSMRLNCTAHTADVEYCVYT